MFDKNYLRAVLSVQSKSHKDEMMLQFLVSELKKVHAKTPLVFEVDDYGNMFITKGERELYPCVVAHTDTVHAIRKSFQVIEVDGVYFAWDSDKREQAGIGGDDKVGIYMCLQALSDMDAIKVAFFRDEEVGCIGSGKADLSWFNDCSFILQADRKGSKDFIDYSNGVDLYDSEFKCGVKGILAKYGYDFEKGVATDVGQLKKRGLEIAVANVSCGYYNAHRDEEYVVISEVENCYNLFVELFTSISDIKWSHKYEPPVYTSGKYYGGYQGGYGYDYAGHGYEWNGRAWVYMGNKNKDKDKVDNASNEDLGFKKKEQTIQSESTQTGEQQSSTWSEETEEEIPEVEYHIAKAKVDAGFRCLGECGQCGEETDFYDDSFDTVICSNCFEHYPFSRARSIIDYVGIVNKYTKTHNPSAYDRYQHYCQCSCEVVDRQAFESACRYCYDGRNVFVD